MAKIACREARPEDIEGLLAVKNSVFPPISRGDWDRERHKTAVVALEDSRVIGAIAMALRPLRVAPGVVIRSAFENSVAVIEGRRGEGIGSAMIECAAGFLRGRADALMVYRADEASAAYRFYRKTGHVPLHRPREIALTKPTPSRAPRTALEESSVIRERQGELRELFAAVWAAWGGFPERDETYWSRALDSYIFAELKHTPALLRVEQAGRLAGYAILGLTTSAIRIEEMAARDDDAARRVLDEIVAHAAERAAEVIAFTAGPAHPYRALLRSVGFVERPRSLTIMARLLDADAFLRNRWRAAGALSGVGVTAWTPRHEFALSEGGDRTLTIEMDEMTMTRWALSRLDAAGAMREERMTLRNARAEDAAAVASALPLVPWIYHSLDDI